MTNRDLLDVSKTQGFVTDFLNDANCLVGGDFALRYVRVENARGIGSAAF